MTSAIDFALRGFSINEGGILVNLLRWNNKWLATQGEWVQFPIDGFVKNHQLEPIGKGEKQSESSKNPKI